MSDFHSMRDRAKDLLARMLEQLEGKDELTFQDASICEKVIKALEILDEAEQRKGKQSKFTAKSTTELEDDFE